MLTSCKLLSAVAFSSICLSFGVSAKAQELPVPGNKNPDWVVEEIASASGMPTLRIYDVPDSQGPGLDKAKASGQRNADTGELMNFYDRRHGVFYDLENGVLEDRTSGRRYRFYRRSAQPKTERNPTKYL